jgi:hypothetical protein
MQRQWRTSSRASLRLKSSFYGCRSSYDIVRMAVHILTRMLAMGCILRPR